jgi:hypothetical protein
MPALRSLIRLVTATVLLAGCGGTGTTPKVSQGPAILSAFVNTESITVTVQPNGTATRTVTLNTSSVTQSVALSTSTTAKLFADLQNAEPLSSLPPTKLHSDNGLKVSWQGETSPDITGALNSAEQSLNDDYSDRQCVSINRALGRRAKRCDCARCLAKATLFSTLPDSIRGAARSSCRLAVLRRGE